MRAAKNKKSVSLLSSIEAVVNGGKAVVSADNSIIIAMVQEALKAGRTGMTFYVSRAQATAVMLWYLSAGRIKQMGVKLVSKEELAKIKSKLGVSIAAGVHPETTCPNGHVYGLFEFMQQGIREHGRDFACAVMELKNAAVLRINPVQDIICPKCNERLYLAGEATQYGMYAPDGTLIYGCCSGELPPILT